MSKIIFFAQPTVGHTNAMLNIAVKLKGLGHDIKFIVPIAEKMSPKILDKMPNFIKTSLAIPEKIKANGIDYISMDIPIKQGLGFWVLPLAKGFEETQFAVKVFSTSLYKYSKEIEKIVLDEKPDAIVNDFFFIAPYIVAEKYDIPCITIYHSGLPFSGKGIPPFGSGLTINGQWGWRGKLYYILSKHNRKLVIKRYKKTCKKMAISDIKDFDLYKPYSKWLNLLLTAKEIEAPREINNDNTIYVGPRSSDKIIYSKENFPFELLKSNTPKIYVSLGTVFNNKPKVFKKILCGLEKMDFQVIVSAGGAYENLINYGFDDNILIFKSVPQLEILKKVDLVISHGGNNTINETLAAGKPIIAMPIGGEQGDNASKIEYLKVGKRINVWNFSMKEILEKVKMVLNEPIYKENAEKIRKILNKMDGVNNSAELINWVAENKKTISLRS